MRTLFCVALVTLWVGAAAGAPAIVATPSSDEVTVESGAFVTRTYTLTNSGDETLSITRVLASCGCTTTTLAKSQLAPGESVDLTAKIDTTGFRGKVIKTVTVQSNDPVHPNLVLRQTINILPSAEEQAAAAAVETPIVATATQNPVSAGTPTTGSPEAAAAAPGTEIPPTWTEPVVAAGALAVLAAGVVTLRALHKRSSAKK